MKPKVFYMKQKFRTAKVEPDVYYIDYKVSRKNKSIWNKIFFWSFNKFFNKALRMGYVKCKITDEYETKKIVLTRELEESIMSYMLRVANISFEDTYYQYSKSKDFAFLLGWKDFEELMVEMNYNMLPYTSLCFSLDYNVRGLGIRVNGQIPVIVVPGMEGVVFLDRGILK